MAKCLKRVVIVLVGAIFALPSSDFVSASTFYKCFDESGKVTFSDHPCNGGKEIEITSPNIPAPKEPWAEKLQQFREYNKAVAIRLRVESIKREISRLNLKRRKLVEERNNRLEELSAELSGWKRYGYWVIVLEKINNMRLDYAKKIGDVDKAIHQKQLELASLRPAVPGERYSHSK